MGSREGLKSQCRRLSGHHLDIQTSSVLTFMYEIHAEDEIPCLVTRCRFTVR